ncbi:MAG TPA: class I SAM-dependent methyltransferase [Anaeromyxobacteraceae bacterium]|jgi:2-polyprenyl-3-methyl-5-hydroxy-6-metoxy-1,4-benzoquinol methylase|nr:class I SAM-dependent methyltransferase [Anaeromyxobacteraceae bacterium]
MTPRDSAVRNEAAGERPGTSTSAPAPEASRFDYGSIPLGHYDRVLREGSGIRRLWHLSKFERVLDYLPRGAGQSLLDIGCFAGSFLSMVPPERFSRQLGVDILPAQIDYANAHHGSQARRFQHVRSIADLGEVDARFDCVTVIEVIEHLTPDEIRALLGHAARLLAPGGRLVLTTPNYASTWPILERILNRVGDVNYQEQHITRFTFFDLERKLAAIHPALRSEFALELRTTTHLLTPFLAGISFDLAHRISRLVPHRRWKLPFGNLILAGFVRR